MTRRFQTPLDLLDASDRQSQRYDLRPLNEIPAFPLLVTKLDGTPHPQRGPRLPSVTAKLNDRGKRISPSALSIFRKTFP